MTKLRVGLFLFLFALTGGMAYAQESTKSWNFSVLLDGSKIGYHTYRVTETNGAKEVESEAKFDVKFLFINAFRYRHNFTETWVNDCLIDIEASTNANGKRFEVSGERTDIGFVVRADKESDSIENELPQCVMTFAYWNPDFLQQRRLLNPQSGEYLDVMVEELESQPIEVRGEQVQARVFSVKAKKMQLTLWYSEDNEWLALESLAKGGRTIRYELS